jgi:hypothetical protein
LSKNNYFEPNFVNSIAGFMHLSAYDLKSSNKWKKACLFSTKTDIEKYYIDISIFIVLSCALSV